MLLFDSALEARRLLDEQPVLYAKIQAALPIERRGVEELVVELMRFLELAAGQTGSLTPSLWVDAAWHEFILCTRAYTDFCRRHWQTYLHHHPGGEESANRLAFRRTRALYTLRYGCLPPERYWGKAAVWEADGSDCGL